MTISAISAIAVVGIGLRVSLPLDQTPVQAPGGTLLCGSVVWGDRVLSNNQSSSSNGGSAESPPSVPVLSLSLALDGWGNSVPGGSSLPLGGLLGSDGSVD